jgi:hypothetical protein
MQSSPAERYSRLHCEHVGDVGGFDLIRISPQRCAQLVPSAVAEAFLGVQSFQTLDDHVKDRVRKTFALSAFMPRRDASRVQRIFLNLVESGMLVSRSDVLNLCRKASARDIAPPSIRTLGIVTQNRVECLERAIVSYVQHARRFDRPLRFLVVDDSPEAHYRQRCRDALTRVAQTYEVPLLYAGREEKVRFSEALMAKGLPPDVIRFALFGTPECRITYGANCNAMLLNTVGELVFNADDDTICRVAPFPARQNELELGRGLTLSTLCYPDAQSAEQSVSVEDQDLLRLHEQYLGRDVRQCIAALERPDLFECGRLDPRTLSHLLQCRSIIAMTFSGLLGDCGLTYPLYYLFLEDESRTSLLTSRETYELWRTRQVVIGARRVTLDDSATFLFHAAGYDNRELLPPFFPVMRGGEYIYAEVLRLVGKGTWFARIPWLVRHDPPGRRRFEKDHFSTVPTRLVECVRALLESSPRLQSEQFHPGIETAVEALGTHLEACGRLPRAEFQHIVRTSLWKMRERAIIRAEALLGQYSARPTYWASDLRVHLKALRRSVQTREPLTPTDLSQAADPDPAALFQRMIVSYGRLLRHWRYMRDAARELAEQGRGLARALPARQRKVP